MHYKKVNKREDVMTQAQLVITHHVVDVCEEMLEEIPQSAQVQAGVFLSVWAVSLAPSHCSVKPELHLLDVQQRLYRL